MSIYNIDFSLMAERVLPPSKRRLLLLKWLKVLLFPLQWLRNTVFINYASGSDSVVEYIQANSYHFGDIVKYRSSVFMNVNTGVTLAGVKPIENPSVWLEVLESDLGVRERLRYNGQKIVLEGLLNRIINGSPTTLTNRIRIIDSAEASLPIFFYNSNEVYYKNLAPVFYTQRVDEVPYTLWFLDYESAYFSPYDFEVQVPSVHSDKIAKITSLVDKYKIAGVTYAIT